MRQKGSYDSGIEVRRIEDGELVLVQVPFDGRVGTEKLTGRGQPLQSPVRDHEDTFGRELRDQPTEGWKID